MSVFISVFYSSIRFPSSVILAFFPVQMPPIVMERGIFQAVTARLRLQINLRLLPVPSGRSCGLQGEPFGEERIVDKLPRKLISNVNSPLS